MTDPDIPAPAANRRECPRDRAHGGGNCRRDGGNDKRERSGAGRLSRGIADVQIGQSLKTVGYGCSSCWGDVGAGDAETDVIYIPFIVSVQHIKY